MFPLWFLIPAIILAFVPALLTFVYVWATDHCRANSAPGALFQNGTLHWACTELLPLTQKTGWLILVTLTAVGLLVLV
jgi:hypothetical protein